MLGRLKKVNKDIVILTSDSSKYNETKITWMPGGTFSCILGKWSMIVIENDSDLKGRWSIFTLEVNAKRILIVNVYRITESTTKGLYTVKAQLDTANTKISNPSKHRKDCLRDLTNFIAQKQEIDKVFLAGDFNKYIKAKAIQDFLIENGLIEIYTFANGQYE